MSTRLFSFGPFRFNPDQRVLLRDGYPVAIEPKVCDLLIALIENRGQLIHKEDLIKEVWVDSFVEEGNLPVTVYKLRRALDESKHDHSYIETVPRRGYRFVASVSEVLNHGGDVSGEPAQTKVHATAIQTEVYGTSGVQKGTVAVLPFKHIGASREEYLGLGLADALITRLSNLKRVTVRPTSSVLKYNGSQDAIEAGRELKVEWVVDGSVQKYRSRLRVTVQLVRVDDGALKWAGKFDEKVNVFHVEDSISEHVSKAVRKRVTQGERKLLAKRYTDNAEAHEAYLRGRYFYAKTTKEGVERGIEYFNQAIAIDPSYALAYAGLADAIRRTFGAFPLLEADLVRAEHAALMALDLDEELAEAHASLGHIRIRQWDWACAERELKRAIELNPNYASAHMRYSMYLRTAGRFDDALREVKIAQEIDPLSLNVSSSLGLLLWLAGRYDEAIESLSATLEMDPSYGLAHFDLGLAYEAKGCYREAALQFREAIALLGNAPELTACLGRIHALSGNVAKARHIIKELKSLSKEHYVPPNFVALIYTALGEQDEAFEWLERGYAEHDEDLALLKVDPRLESLRDDPRFESLLQRIGLTNATNRQTLAAASGGRPS